MIGKLLIAAGFGALLSVAPALAQDVQQQGMSSEQTQSDQLYKKKKSKMTEPQGQTTGNDQQTEQNQATGQEGQPAKKKKLQQNTQTEDQQNTQTEEMNQQAT